MWKCGNVEMWKSVRVVEAGDEAALAQVLDRSPARNSEIDAAAAGIVADVRGRGDDALREYAARFDNVQGPIEVSRADMRRAARAVAPAVRRAIAHAARNVRHVAARQLPKRWRTSPVSGVRIEQR